MGLFDWIRRDSQKINKETKYGPTSKLIEEFKRVNNITSVSPKERLLMEKYIDLITKPTEIIKLKGKDFPNNIGKLPSYARTAMWCIIREGNNPPNILDYFSILIEKSTNKPVIYEDMDIYFHAIGKLQPYIKDEDSIISTILAHKMLIEQFHSGSTEPFYYGMPTDFKNITYKVFSDHTNNKYISYSAYRLK